MERLTFEGNFCDIAMCDAEPDICGICDQRKVWERLKAYEDTELEPEDFKKAFNEDALLKMTAQYLGTTPDRLREWAKADKEDRLVALPCKVGDTVWFVDRRWDRTLGRGVSFVNDGYVKAIKFSSRPTKITVEYPDHNDREGRCRGADYFARNIGKTAFLTREEAEAALAGEGGKHETD